MDLWFWTHYPLQDYNYRIPLRDDSEYWVTEEEYVESNDESDSPDDEYNGGYVGNDWFVNEDELESDDTIDSSAEQF